VGCPEMEALFVVAMNEDNRRQTSSGRLRKEKPMCPVCISTVALTVAGATSTGGLTAFVVKKLLPKSGPNKSHRKPDQKESF